MEDYDNADVDFEQGKLLGTPYYTPYHKQVSKKSGLQPLNMDLSAESSGDSSAASLKEGARSPSSPSWDSDPEYVIPPVNLPDMEQQNQLGGEEKGNASMLWERENRSYDGLLKKFIENEEELRVSNYKLKLSEEEVVKLKSQIEKSEVQLGNVQKESKLKEDDLAYEKERALELQKQTAELETHVSDCCYKIAKLGEQLDVANTQLKKSDDEIARLTNELGIKSSETHHLQGKLEVAEENVAKFECQIDTWRKQIQELEERISWYKSNETSLELEVLNLKAEMLDAQKRFTLEKDQLESDIISLSAMGTELTSQLEEWEARSNALENKLKQYEAENLEQKELHACEQTVWQQKISSLKEEHCMRTGELKAVHKEAMLQLEKKILLYGCEKNALENKLRKYEAENLEQKELHACEQMVWQQKFSSLREELCMRTRELEAVRKEAVLQVNKQMVLHGEISSLKEELDQRRHNLDALNKEFDRHKLKFDMLMTERDEANAKIDNLKAVISSKDDEIANMEGDLLQLRAQRQELKSGYETAVNLINALKSKVEELEKEATRRAEEKREAIRQLCFSLEYYRGGYQELVQAFAGQRHLAVMAS